jgi:hypothetical protein
MPATKKNFHELKKLIDQLLAKATDPATSEEERRTAAMAAAKLAVEHGIPWEPAGSVAAARAGTNDAPSGDNGADIPEDPWARLRPVTHNISKDAHTIAAALENDDRVFTRDAKLVRVVGTSTGLRIEPISSELLSAYVGDHVDFVSAGDIKRASPPAKNLSQ